MVRRIILLFFLLIGIAGVIIAYNVLAPFQTTEPRTVTIEPGMGVREIGQLLAESKIIRSPFLFEAYIYADRSSSRLKAGTYTFLSPSLAGVVRTLKRGESRKQIRITFPEGWTRAQMAELVAKKTQVSEESFLAATGKEAVKSWSKSFSFLKTLPENRSLEGYLFPDTYRFFADVTAEEMVQKMLDAFSQKAMPVLSRTSLHGLSLDEKVILASIIEREVQTANDMKIAAGIFLKRISIGMPLQADSTVNYVTGGSKPAVSLAETKIKSPYNTYQTAGLPPGPISNPGVNALTATIEPTETPYLYFLTAPDGTVIYSKTFAEHVAAKRKYLSSP